MDINETKQILKLNKDFYQSLAKDFSKTRQSPWIGWNKLIPIIKGFKTIRVLDVACGNGRFYDFILKQSASEMVDYFGIDTNDIFINEAKSKYKTARFENLDAVEDINTIKEEFNLVVCFGFTHHIPGQENRKKWFEAVSHLILPGGYLIFTTWSATKLGKTAKMSTKGDNLGGWGDTGQKRYIHIYDQKELDEIGEVLHKRKLKLISTYTSDGRTNNLNTYFVFKRD
ncbi:hypothetical protein A3K34_01760 [candidate division WWE3 bacterium RIFOXYC1_FULL_40_10]|uniref:Methyltransferase type 12 domain-containing protein n=1 Tax=candidate division WWE3 bacterium RIFOXYA2_FULL_46_9 TaxID=1802636 RepID=A0A1F4W2J4_UNCKA|nr:MAG: hypothetical protein A3K58_01760 [candidate division WWE3 bacterium RIFOXYB1_FULL_40_22]OGC61589.1 MAG: hypothetical protein A3K37_01760 [candidate division WWE3 bacterium RIFOXYA1_FULL_40_11]OGC63636.1 MAG: hypothetical protein A2264_04705 [candidate division WWE3 bacterium RIFOXYA2_FULL_46_9]OGC64733.1 MAG: hypothetical protein A2326_01690 [candidate division WWE3 bacterium RIFOXYB2_FULL_41_6]OGC65972.1 MAG: hypothetical protein A3K34_01760 [candidate division WWE3 bacterium RIFOXYC1_